MSSRAHDAEKTYHHAGRLWFPFCVQCVTISVPVWQIRSP
jgi:hypothetical protein